MGIFKAYDIRGLYPAELDEHLAFQIGAAFGSLNPGTIAVGCDARLSGPSLKTQLIRGICSTGSDVVEVGLTTTPMIVFATKQLGAEGGVNVTASHNPKEYNGFKLFDRAAMPISYESGIAQVEALVERGEYSKGAGASSTRSIAEEYLAFLRASVKPRKRLCIVLDGSNGPAGSYAPAAFRQLGMTVHELNCTPDGTFPGHEPDPTRAENLAEAQRQVREVGADLGFVYDGDGDRLAVIAEDGRAIESRRIFSLLVQQMLSERPGAKVVHDVLMSQMALDTIRRYGGVPIASKVGHTYIAQRMQDEAAALGGELSGHFYFNETHYADDAIFASLKVLELVAREGRPISALVQDFPEYLTDNVRVAIRDVEKFSFIARLRADLERNGYAIETLDGVKVRFEHGWALFRASNTEPKLSIAYESCDTGEFNRIKRFVESVIERVPQDDEGRHTGRG